jgi:hypothetical protein
MRLQTNSLMGCRKILTPAAGPVMVPATRHQSRGAHAQATNLRSNSCRLTCIATPAAAQSTEEPHPTWEVGEDKGKKPKDGEVGSQYQAGVCRGTFTEPLIERDTVGPYLFWGAYQQCTSRVAQSIASELRQCREVGTNLACDIVKAYGPYVFDAAYFIRSDVQPRCSSTTSRLYRLRATSITVKNISYPDQFSALRSVACAV